MPRGNRLLIIALGVVATIAIAIGVWTWPEPPTLVSYGEEHPRNTQYRPGGEDCDPASLSAIRDNGKRSGQANACAKEAEEYRQNTNDLIQQTRAANGAQAQADIASQQLWTGWLQTLGGFLTLAAAVGAAIYAREAARHTETGAKEAKRSADEAEKAAYAALGSLSESREANQIARDFGRSQLRPYVAFASHSDEDDDKPLDFSVDGFLRFKIKNFGSTPARNVALRRGADIFKAPIGDAQVELGEGQEYIGTLAPGADLATKIYLRDLPSDTFEIVKKGEFSLIIRIWVGYDVDGFTRDEDDLSFIVSKYLLDANRGGARLTSEERQRR